MVENAKIKKNCMRHFELFSNNVRRRNQIGRNGQFVQMSNLSANRM